MLSPAYALVSCSSALCAACFCAACLLLVSRFDLMQMAETVREGWKAHSANRQQKQQQEAYQQQLALQQQQAEEAERMRQNAAYMRRGQQAQPAARGIFLTQEEQTSCQKV